MRSSDGGQPLPPAGAPEAGPAGSHARARQESREREGIPAEWILERKAAVSRSPAASRLVGPLYSSTRAFVSALYRGLIRVPVVGRLVWWVWRTLKAPRTVDELLDHLAAAQDRIVELERRAAAQGEALGAERAKVERLNLEVKDLRGDNPLSGALYEAFEAEFRGDPSVIGQRAEVYLPIITSVSAGIPEFPVLDVGCGRGEWLQLLAGRGLSARGVDFNSTFVERARALGLAVEEGEAIRCLSTTPAASLGALTAFHLVEHLELNALFALIREAYRVLRPGGVVIVETPNPENLVVGSCSFYNDPTHRRPIPPQTLSFYLRHAGFSNVTVTSLAPLNLVEAPVDDALKPIVDRFNIGQDYAAIGYRL